MDDYVERLISSHKMAAKRAAAHLQKTRNLKLQPNEALELVAQISGVNWQTLLGLAKQGRVPENSALPDASPVQPAAIEWQTVYPLPSPHGKSFLAERNVAVSGAEPAHPESDASIVSRLAAYHLPANGGNSGHPIFSRKRWIEKTQKSVPYWPWVLQCIRDYDGMLPWDRDAMPEYQLAHAAGATVMLPDNLGFWYVEMSSSWPWHENKDVLAEAHAYQYIAGCVTEKGRRIAGADWDALSFTEQLKIVEQRCCARDAEQVPVNATVAHDVLVGNRAICAAAGMSVFANVPETEQPITWLATDGAVFATEAAAYAHQERLVQTYVSYAFHWSDEVWLWSPRRRKLKLARVHAAAGRVRHEARLAERAAAAPAT